MSWSTTASLVAMTSLPTSVLLMSTRGSLSRVSIENSLAWPSRLSMGSNQKILPVFTRPAGPRLMLSKVCTLVVSVFTTLRA